MVNLKLDIENKLWAYYMLEPYIKFISFIENSVGDEAAIENLKDSATQINNTNNQVLKAVNSIKTSQKLKFEVLVFEKTAAKLKSLLGCFNSGNCLYLFYDPLILDELNEKEIYSSVAHEIGHIMYPMPMNPANYIEISERFYGSNTPDYYRFIIFSYLLTHLNEYNADRYAHYVTKDLDSFISQSKKLSFLNNKAFTGSLTESEAEDIASKEWYSKFCFKHPTINNRITALKLIDDKIQENGFNINETPVISQKLKELISYDKFIEMFGEYYEDLLKKSAEKDDGKKDNDSLGLDMFNFF